MDLFDEKIHQWFAKGKVWGMHLNVKNDDILYGYALLINKKKDSIFIEDLIELNKIEDLNIACFKNVPIALSIESDMVLTKNVKEFQTNKIAQEFHLTDTSYFKTQVVKLSSSFNISIIRENSFNYFVKKLSDVQLNIVSTSLGAVNMVCCIDHIGGIEKMNKLTSCNYLIHISNKEIYNIESNNSIYNENKTVIGEYKILNKYLISYANAISYFLCGDEPSYIQKRVNNFLIIESTFKKLYKFLMPICLGLLLSILLVNFLVLQVYNSKLGELTNEQQSLQLLYIQQTKLEQQIKDREKILGKYGSSNYTEYTYYIDQVGRLVNGQFSLEQLELNPLIESKKNINDIKIENGLMIVSGQCLSPKKLNTWMNRVLDEPFVNSITKQDYSYNEFENIGFFKIDFKLQNK